MRALRIIILFFFVVLPLSNVLSKTVSRHHFITELVKTDHFNRTELTQLLDGLHKDPRIIQKMTAPKESISWKQYRNYFLTSKRIQDGALYWKKHQNDLQYAEKKYGVPASIIIAIVGIESSYGKHMGTFPVLNTLYTLSFYYPPRAAYFQQELRQYLLLVRENHLSFSTLPGSYAGAVGIPQFMPSSYRRFAMSRAKNHSADLFHNHRDAIISIANYLQKNGWKRHQAIAKINTKTEDNPKRWILYHNFKTILTYNHSPSYAMIVYQLSEAVKKQYFYERSQAKSARLAQARSTRHSKKILHTIS